ncbi:MAG: hypothetical protein AAF493_00265 [Pseudomonadota bacterium]
MNTLLGAIIPERYAYLRTVLRYVGTLIRRQNRLKLAMSLFFGVSVRVLNLAGFALTLKAIVAAIKPSIVTDFIAVYAAKYVSLPPNINDYIVVILAGCVIAIFGLKLIFAHLHFYLQSQLVRSFVVDKSNFEPNRIFEQDVFVLENLPLTVQAIEKSIEIIIFVLLMLGFIAFIAPLLALLLIPTLSLLVMASVVRDRKSLRESNAQRETKVRYVERVDEHYGDDGVKRPLDCEERERYFAARVQRQRRVALNPQLDSFFGATAIVLVIYYLAQSNIDAESLAGLLLVFVIGIRYVVAAGRELSINVSRILELRKFLRFLDSEPNSSEHARDAATTQTTVQG